VSVDLAGIQTLELRVTDAGDGITLDHADWAEVRITMRTGRPVALKRPPEPQVILTPAAPVQPRLTGPRIVGTRTGVPFMHRLTATGERPLEFSAQGLPSGLRLNAETGMLEGVISTDQTWRVQVTARNRHGAARQELRVVAGASPALTPPLGWNSWNAFGCEVDDAKIRAAADALAASGLADHGWVYINIDDCWQGERDVQGRIRSNARFPDLRALCDYLHARGFKAGVYSSPGPRTCASHPGSLGHETGDAQQYAEWGFDYLKYDWCSYGNLVPNATLDQLQAPYRLMRAALDAAPRNIVYSLCQYGQGKVSEWGRAVGGDSWRTTGDITDTWSSLGDIMRRQGGLERYAGPGAWNDMDMLVLGHVGWSAATRPTRLTPNEQYAHLSWWAMHCSPLLLGCDPARLDAFTVSLLSNDEVLEVNQDPLGRQAGPLPAPAPFQIRVKQMEDGSRVLGIFNFGEEPAALDLRAADLGLAKVKRIRDLWRQQDLKPAPVTIPRHGVVLLRVW
jgi:alpha-galactosidase